MILYNSKSRSLTILFLCIGFISINEHAIANPTRTVISGTINSLVNSNNNTATLIKWNSKNLLDAVSETSVKVDEKGGFKFVIMLDQSEPVVIAINDRRILVSVYSQHSFVASPGDSLYFKVPDLDTSEISKVKISGKGAEKLLLQRDVAVAINALDRKNNLGNKQLQNLITLNEYYDLYFDQVISEKKILNKILSQNKYKLSKDQTNDIKVHILSKIYAKMLGCFGEVDLTTSVAKERYARTKDEFIISDLLIDGDLPSVVDISIDFNFFKNALIEYLFRENLPSYSVFATQGRDYSFEYDIIKNSYKQSAFRPRLLAAFIVYRAIQKGWTSDIDSLANDFYSEIPDGDPFRAQLMILQSKLDISKKECNNAYNFALQDTLGVIHSLSNFKGKVVLLDFMFNGCGGCAQMAPYLTEVEHNFEGQEVVFISISIDKSLTTFKKGIDKFMAKGSIPLYTNGEGGNHEVIKAYSIGSYPTLVLIDKKGCIVDFRAPDPRYPIEKAELIYLITKALEK